MDGHLLQGFVQQHSLELAAIPGGFRIYGTIACNGRIVISVSKRLALLDDSNDPYVQTVKYAYNAFVAGHGAFLRHDNVHVQPGHADAHHVHHMNWRDGREVPGSPTCCGEQGWPNLSQFIDAVQLWYDEHREELPDPDGVVEDLTIYDERLKVEP